VKTDRLGADFQSGLKPSRLEPTFTPE